MTLAEINDELGAGRTNKKEFLDKLEAIIPWEIFLELIQPSYYKGELGNKPYLLELMKKSVHMVTADILEQTRDQKQSRKTKMGKRSSIGSTDVRHPSKNYQRVVSMPLRKKSIRNHPSAVRWNMSLQS